MATLPLYMTTTTAPPWPFIFADAQGNVPPSFASAVCTLTFRSCSNGQKVRGAGTFPVTNPTTGLATYNLSATDLATVYAAFSANPGTETFELFAEAVIGALVYDGVPPPQIQIRKI